MTFKIKRGTNISHWLSQSDRRGQDRRQWFTVEDVHRLASLGLDHLRLPVDEDQMWDAEGNRHTEAWDLMTSCLDWCERAGLRVIVDLHILRSHYFNAAATPPLFSDPAEPERFARLWRDLSAALNARALDQVAYELMNEPVAPDPAQWNRAYRPAYESIRSIEPERVIVLGSNRWSSANTFDGLAIPPGDPNLILTFHYYSPMFVTHYRAPWSRECKAYSGPVRYPGSPLPLEEFARLRAEVPSLTEEWNKPYSAQVMEADLAQPLKARCRTGLPLYCGEFGVLHTVPAPVRTAWYRDFREVLERQGIAWANWDYKGGFGLMDGEGHPTCVVNALLDASPQA